MLFPPSSGCGRLSPQRLNGCQYLYDIANAGLLSGRNPKETLYPRNEAVLLAQNATRNAQRWLLHTNISKRDRYTNPCGTNVCRGLAVRN